MKFGPVFYGHFQCLYRAADTCLSAADIFMCPHRYVLSEHFFGLFQICLDYGLVFAVDQYSCVLEAEQFLEGVALVHKHVSGGGTHEDFDACEH